MDEKLKQRLIGAVVLSCLAIILLPLLLNGTEEGRMVSVSVIPSPPKIDLSDITVNDVKRKIVEMERASEKRLPREIVDESNYEIAGAHSLDKNNLPVNWSVRLGSFEKKENAIRLRNRLRAENYRSYIYYSNTNDGEMYRVFVGPLSSKKKLAPINRELEEKFKLRGSIVRYRVEEDQELLEE